MGMYWGSSNELRLITRGGRVTIAKILIRNMLPTHTPKIRSVSTDTDRNIK